MPEAVFAHLWSYLKDGRPWMGIVKNRCRNGDFYWVCAYVTPMLVEGRVVGYESVRVKPEAEQGRRATALYADMRAGRSQVISRRRWRPLMPPVLASVPPLLAWQLSGTALGMGVSLATLFLLYGWQVSHHSRLLGRLHAGMQGAFDSELAARVFSTLRGRPAQMQQRSACGGGIRSGRARAGRHRARHACVGGAFQPLAGAASNRGDGVHCRPRS
jgi:aerotaxis receptor